MRLTIVSHGEHVHRRSYKRVKYTNRTMDAGKPPAVPAGVTLFLARGISSSDCRPGGTPTFFPALVSPRRYQFAMAAARTLRIGRLALLCEVVSCD